MVKQRHIYSHQKENAVYEMQEERDIFDDWDHGIIKDEMIVLKPKDKREFSLQRVAHYDAQKDKIYIFISNQLELDTEQIAMICKSDG